MLRLVRVRRDGLLPSAESPCMFTPLASRKLRQASTFSIWNRRHASGEDGPGQAGRCGRPRRDPWGGHAPARPERPTHARALPPGHDWQLKGKNASLAAGGEKAAHTGRFYGLSWDDKSGDMLYMALVTKRVFHVMAELGQQWVTNHKPAPFKHFHTYSYLLTVRFTWSYIIWHYNMLVYTICWFIR